jgi:hypothetical protein
MGHLVECVFVGERPEPARLNPVGMALVDEAGDRARSKGKPTGGLWTVRRRPGAASSGLDWAAFGQTNGLLKRLGPDRLWLLRADAPRLYTIDGHDALVAAVSRYPHHFQSSELRPGEAPFEGAFGDERPDEIDFAALAADGYDGVDVTSRALAECHGGYPIGLWAWDVPSLVWLRWAFSSVEPL